MIRLYIKNALKSIAFYSCFSIIYNLIIFFLSERAYNYNISYYLDLTAAIYFKVYKCVDCNWPGFHYFRENQILFLIPHSVFSNIILAILIGVSFTFLIHKLKLVGDISKAWKKAILVSIFWSLLIPSIILISEYFYYKHNQDLSWFPKDYIFEKYYPAVKMFDYKNIYIIIGFVIGTIFISKQKKLPNNKLKQWIRPGSV